MRLAVIAWAAPGGRSVALADGLGAEMHNIVTTIPRRRLTLPLRYLVQSARTAALIVRTRPDVVIVQNPPIVSALIVHLTQLVLRRGKLIIDSHTGAFLDPNWSPFLRLFQWLAGRAAMTLVHNSAQAATIESWGVPWMQVAYVTSPYLQGDDPRVAPESGGPGSGVEPATPEPMPTVLAVCSGGYDEPIDAIAEAARSLPEVTFEVTGRRERIEARLSVTPPDNLKLLGMLSFDDYLGHMRRSSAILTLTTRPATLLNGGLEAIALAKPLVISDSEVLQDYFCRGTVHTANDGPSIAAAVSKTLGQLQELSDDMLAYSRECDAEWERIKIELVGTASS